MQRIIQFMRLINRNIEPMKNPYFKLTSSVFLAIIVTLLGSCGKKFKETSPLNVTVKMVNTDVSEHFSFESGEMYLGTFGMNGDRKQGDDVLFSNVLSDGTTADLKTGVISPVLTYDLPQGTYTTLSINLGSKPKQSLGAIRLIGKYIQIEQGGEQETHQIVFQYSPATMYSLNAITSGEINILSDKSTTVKIEMDAHYLFSAVPENLWHTAQHIELDGKETIFITDINNTSIYNLLITRLNAAFSVHIE